MVATAPTDAGPGNGPAGPGHPTGSSRAIDPRRSGPPTLPGDHLANHPDSVTDQRARGGRTRPPVPQPRQETARRMTMTTSTSAWPAVAGPHAELLDWLAGNGVEY